MHTCNKTIWRLQAAILAIIIAGGCSNKPKPYAADIDAVAAGYAALREYDDNTDGKISGAELEKAASLKSNLAIIDTDKDSAASSDEITDRIIYWQKTNMLRSRTPMHCTVYHNQKFLAGADVKLVPEKFLGDKMKAAKGRTNANGVAVLAMEDAQPGDPPGVSPGFYRVEITKSGEDIPAKYNTKTILGLDPTPDNPLIRKGIRFDLDY